MSRRHNILAVMTLSLLLLTGLVCVIGLAVTKYTDQAVEMAGERELSLEEIKPAFLRLTGHALPLRAEGLRAIYEGGLDPGIFVRFETDVNGIAYVMQTFSGRRSTVRIMDGNDLTAMHYGGNALFPGPYLWQRELGITLFDAESIESGRLLESGPFFGIHYKILVDDRRNVVYIYAYER